MKPFPAGVLVLASLLAACGGGSHPATDTGADDLGQDTAPPVPSIDTVLSTTTVKAGQEVAVTCVGHGFAQDQAELVVRLASQGIPTGGPSGGEDATVGEDPYVGPDETPDLALPEGVTREGMVLKFTRVEVYTVACWAPDTRMLDKSPARVVVRPATAATVETSVTPTDIKAGETVTVTCTGVDIYGNPLESQMVPGVSPPAGVTIQGMLVQLTKVGTYQVACGVKDTAILDPTPVTVTVSPNLPKRIVTTVTPDTFEAGGSAALSCKALDYYDNPVTNLPMSVQKPDALALDRLTLSGTLAGLYVVKCVPETSEWKYFTLVPASVTVTPGPPVTLLLNPVPRKPFYGKNETLTVTAEARDAYGNLVPEAMVQAPVEIDPPQGITPVTGKETRVFQLKEEGVYRMTFRLAGFPTVYATLDVTVEGSGPLLSIESPERGDSFTDKPSVNLMGSVNDDESGVQCVWYKLNRLDMDDPCPVPQPPPEGQTCWIDSTHCWTLMRLQAGTFSTVLNHLNQGVNVVTVAAINNAGSLVTTSRAFQYSRVFYPPPSRNAALAVVHDGVLAFLSRFFIDDGDHAVPPNPDDLATILEMVVSSLNLSALLPNPLAEAGPYKVTIPSITYGKPQFNLYLYDGETANDPGGIHLVMSIPNVKVDIAAIGRCDFIIDWCPDVTGDVSFSQLRAISDIDVGMDASGQVVATMKNIQVDLGGMQVHIDGLLGTLLDGIINLLLDAFRQTLTDTLETQVASLVNETLTNALKQLDIDQSLEIPSLLGNPPKAIRLRVKPSNLKVRTEGIDVAMDGTISAIKGVLHEPLGSIGRANCNLFPYDADRTGFDLPWDEEVVLGAFDDLLNQALYAVWYAGTLNLTITQADLGDFESPIDLRDLKVTLDFYLPPILTDCSDKRQLQAQVGDLYAWVDVILLDNPLQLGAFVNATATASLYLTPGETGKTAVAVRLDDIDMLDLEVVSINEDFPLTADDLMTMLKGQVLDEALKGVKGKELFAFEIPSIDMSGLSPMLPPDLTLDIHLTDLSRDRGHTVVKGLLGQPAPTP